MKTLVTANQKGGVGKTSTLVHLAFDAVDRGLKVVIIDLDTQANASYTMQRYSSGVTASQLFSGNPVALVAPDEAGIALIDSDANLANLERADTNRANRNFLQAVQQIAGGGFDLCLIDTAPSLGAGLAAALTAADYVLSPIELEAYSIMGIQKILKAISNVKLVNSHIRFLGMVPSKFDRRNKRHETYLAELTKAYPNMLIPTRIGLRSSIADALAAGVPVWKIRKTAARVAAREMRALAEYVFKKMELIQ